MLLFQDFLSFMANNITEQPDYLPLKSIPRVFSLLKVQFQFYNDEVTDIFFQCNCCNKTVTCQFSETMLIEFLHVFIKAVVYHHVGL